MSKNLLGTKLRQLREEHHYPLRKVAALLDIDVAILSKIERGQRKPTRDIVSRLAEIYQRDPQELLILYLADKVLYELGEEELATKALSMAEEQVAYSRTTHKNKEIIIEKIKQYIKQDKRVTAAWLFGSFARGEYNHQSDIDLMVRFDKSQTISLFDLADITGNLERITHRKVDLVEEGNLSTFALKTAQKDFIKIYG